MVDKKLRERVTAMIHREVVPAIGCTEPMCVSVRRKASLMTMWTGAYIT